MTPDIREEFFDQLVTPLLCLPPSHKQEYIGLGPGVRSNIHTKLADVTFDICQADQRRSRGVLSLIGIRCHDVGEIGIGVRSSIAEIIARKNMAVPSLQFDVRAELESDRISLG